MFSKSPIYSRRVCLKRSLFRHTLREYSCTLSWPVYERVASGDPASSSRYIPNIDSEKSPIDSEKSLLYSEKRHNV